MIVCLGHVVFQIVLASHDAYGSLVPQGSSLESTWRQIGYTRLNIHWSTAIRLVLPDFVVIAAVEVARRHLKSPIAATGIEAQPLRSIASWFGNKKPLIITFFLAGVSFPSLTAMMYTACLVLSLIVWALRGRQSKPINLVPYLYPAIIYCGVNIVLLFLYQMDFFQDYTERKTGELFGLIMLVNNTDIQSTLNPLSIHYGDYSWPAYVHPVMLVFIFVTLANYLNAKTREQKNRNSTNRSFRTMRSRHSSTSVSGEEQTPLLHVEASITETTQDNDTFIANFITKAENIFVDNNYILTLTFMTLWAFLFPSYMGLVLMLWAAPFWMRWREVFLANTPQLLLFTSLLILVDYILSLSPNIGKSADMAVDVHTGLPTLVAVLSAKLAFFMYFCVTTKLRRLVIDPDERRDWFQRARTRTQSSITDSPASQGEAGAVNADGIAESPIRPLARQPFLDLNEDNDAGGLRVNVPPKKLRFSKDVWAHIQDFQDRVSTGMSVFLRVSVNAFNSIVEFVIVNLYLAILVLVYFCVLDEVSVLNSIYVGIFLVFITHPPYARRWWSFLVAFSEFQIIIQYIWGFSIFNRVSLHINTILGVDSDIFSSLWWNLKWDIAIFTLSIIQFHVYRLAKISTIRMKQSLLDRSDSSSSVGQDANSPSTHETPTEVFVFDRIRIFIQKAIVDFWIVIAGVTLALVGLLGRVRFINMGYLFLLFAYVNLVLVLSTRLRIALNVLWTFITIYCLAAFAMMYVYQFPDLRNEIVDSICKNFTSTTSAPNEPTIDCDHDILGDIGLVLESSQGLRFQYLVGIFVNCVLFY